MWVVLQYLRTSFVEKEQNCVWEWRNEYKVSPSKGEDAVTGVVRAPYLQIAMYTLTPRRVFVIPSKMSAVQLAR